MININLYNKKVYKSYLSFVYKVNNKFIKLKSSKISIMGKTMIKKSIVIIGIAFALFAIVLSGCNEQSLDKESTSKFIGTWKVSERNETWTFYENKTVEIIYGMNGKFSTKIYNWNETNDELCTSLPLVNNSITRCGIYEFNNSSSSFIWTTTEPQTTLIFVKI